MVVLCFKASLPLLLLQTVKLDAEFISELWNRAFMRSNEFCDFRLCNVENLMDSIAVIIVSFDSTKTKV